MDKKVLEMEFVDQAEKKYTLRVDDPKDDLTGQEVKAKMDDILAQDGFRNKGVVLKEAKAARVVTTSVTELELA